MDIGITSKHLTASNEPSRQSIISNGTTNPGRSSFPKLFALLGREGYFNRGSKYLITRPNASVFLVRSGKPYNQTFRRVILPRASPVGPLSPNSRSFSVTFEYATNIWHEPRPSKAINIKLKRMSEDLSSRGQIMQQRTVDICVEPPQPASAPLGISVGWQRDVTITSP